MLFCHKILRLLRARSALIPTATLTDSSIVLALSHYCKPIWFDEKGGTKSLKRVEIRTECLVKRAKQTSTIRRGLTYHVEIDKCSRDHSQRGS